jgi:hypothetical protein
VPVRVSPTDRIRRHIDELFADGRPLPEILEEVARLGAQLLMQAALEAEVTEFLGRDRYQRAAACEDARPGSRNGYRDVTVKTTAGPVKLARPKLRGSAGAFASRLFGAHVTKTNALESLVIASFVRGLSVRDVEAALAEALGDQAAISKSTVSSVCQAIKGEYEAWALRRLEGITLDYLFLDASFFRMHPGSPAEPVLAAWGITTGGKPCAVPKPCLGTDLVLYARRSCLFVSSTCPWSGCSAGWCSWSGVTPRRTRRSWSSGTRSRCCDVRSAARRQTGLTAPCSPPWPGCCPDTCGCTGS